MTYLRWPDLHGDRIVFVAGAALWTAPVTGGLASLLVRGEVSTPRFSPDGALVAYADPEVSTIRLSSDGVPARRLTSDGVPAEVAGWVGGRIVYASSARQPVPVARLHTVDLEGVVEPYGSMRAGAVAFGPGLVAVRTGLGDQARRKRYRGGAAGALWVSDGGRFRRLDLPPGVDAPCWVGERLYFLSDHEGVGQVCSCAPDGSDLTVHTSGEYYARALAGDGQRLVFQRAGAIFLLDPATHDEWEAPVAVPEESIADVEVPAAGNLGSLDISPDGSRLAITVRGRAVSVDVESGAAREHGDPDVRHRLVSWLDSQRLLGVASAGREHERLVVFGDGPVPHGDLGVITELAVHPNGTRVALATGRQELLLVELSDATVTLLARNNFDPVRDLTWSPDGVWLACSFPESPHTASIWLFDRHGHTRQARVPLGVDRSPSFSDDRTLHFTGPGEFTSQIGPAGEIAVRAVSTWFAMDLDSGQVKAMRAGECRQVLATTDGVVTRAADGSLSTDPPTRADAVLVSADRTTVVCLDRGALRIAGRPLDLADIRVEISPRAQWRQMFGEAWRLQREHVWDTARVGAAWDTAWERYAPLVERVRTRAELSDLLAELHGELSASHTDERPPRRGPVPDRGPWHTAWVTANRRRVHGVSGGRIGYLHLPDLGKRGFTRFREAMVTEGGLAGLVVDVRGNEGGHASWQVLDELSRRQRGSRVSRYGRARAWPAPAPEALVVVADEYTGSDGELFCAAFRAAGLGPIVGARTWGGAVGVRPRHSLVDGAVTTQPEFAFEVGEPIEGRGVSPDVAVDAQPHGPGCLDPQLDSAVALLLARLRLLPRSGDPVCRSCYRGSRWGTSEGEIG
ncbi:S41 family peptidase [Actinokineospora diospyrosa]|uniref:Peptidase family S41 n=1 Tax=Actinokineospora diospyrosa TaxID=103728 RepID=A0ABT1IA28_9PSEU|nr:S41 family peptidase [Actinokineospora diospyrosa]MCP2269391.1 Peptidase family S41 [Actinokineospora diospyrosa]